MALFAGLLPRHALRHYGFGSCGLLMDQTRHQAGLKTSQDTCQDLHAGTSSTAANSGTCRVMGGEKTQEIPLKTASNRW